MFRHWSSITGTSNVRRRRLFISGELRGGADRVVSLVIVIALLSHFSSSRLKLKRNAVDGLTDRISGSKRAALPCRRSSRRDRFRLTGTHWPQHGNGCFGGDYRSTCGCSM